MKTQILIDAIVRQTTVLIARLSTAEGARSPLGHVANEVFAGLVAELENQGVSKKVVADMFGMALRSYRQKVQRLGESATSRGVTLWSAIQTYLSERESASRNEVLERFKFDDEVSVRGILNDLVEGGFIIRSGRGVDTRYRAATEEELLDLGTSLEDRSVESLAAYVWLQIYREGPLNAKKLAQHVPVSESLLQSALKMLMDKGQIQLQDQGSETLYTTEQVLIPLGESAGWEAAVIDHHRQVLNAIAAKIGSGNRASAKQDEVGGTTLTFSLRPGHPKEQEVRRLLAEMRSRVLPLWDEVTQYNDKHPISEEYKVHFYFGQYLVAEEELS